MRTSLNQRHTVCMCVTASMWFYQWILSVFAQFRRTIHWMNFMFNPNDGRGGKFCLLKNQNFIVFSEIILSFSFCFSFSCSLVLAIINAIKCNTIFVCLRILGYGISFCYPLSKRIKCGFTGLVVSPESSHFIFIYLVRSKMKQFKPLCLVKFSRCVSVFNGIIIMKHQRIHNWNVILFVFFLFVKMQ